MSGNDKQDLYNNESTEKIINTQSSTQSDSIAEESPDNTKSKVKANTPVLLLLNPEPERINTQNLSNK